MNYKLSRFTITQKDEKGDIIIFGSASHAIVRFSEDHYNRFMKQLENQDFNEDDPTFCYLKEKSILVEEGVDEERFADYIYSKANDTNDFFEITIMPTEACNFRCVYCYEKHTVGVMSQETQDSLVRFVKKMMRNRGSLVINWFGGEPLLCVDIIESLTMRFKEICKKYKKSYTAHMTTNGYLLTWETFQRLKKLNITTYQITVDGLSETHDKQRFLVNGEGTFDRIMENLKTIRDNEKSGLFSVVLRTNITKQMLPTIGKFYDYIMKEFKSDKRFVLRARAAWNGAEDESFEDQILHESDVNGVMDENTLYNRLQNEENYQVIKNAFDDLVRNFSPCYAGKQNCIIVDPEGKIHKCTANLYEKHCYVGELQSDGSIHYDLATYLPWVTRLTDSESREECYKCPLFPICRGIGCPYKSMNREMRKLTCKAKVRDLSNAILMYAKTEAVCKRMEE